MAVDTIIFTSEDLEPVRIPVTMGETSYILVEPDESAGIRYRNHFLRCTKMEDGKVVGMDGIHEGDSLLVSFCLFRTDKEGKLRLDANDNPDKRHLVPLSVISTWKPKVVKLLADKLKKIGDLEQEESLEFLERRMEDDKRKIEILKKTGSRTMVEDRAKNGQTSMEAITDLPRI